MISFYRRLRKQLLSGNRFSRYLIYAIGEIVLVVIGILIALQINTWNEERKLQEQEKIYLQNLRDDLKAQIAILGDNIEFENIIIDQSTDIAGHYEFHNGFKNMDSIFPKLNDLSVRRTFLNTTTTLIEMINSGQINIIRNKELKTELIEFNQVIETFSRVTQNNNTNLIDNLTVPTLIDKSAYASYGYSDKMTENFKDFYLLNFLKVSDNELKNISTEILDDPENQLELINKVVFRNNMAHIQKSGNERIKNLASQLLQSVEQELQEK